MFNVVLRERSKRDVDRYVDEIMRKVRNERERNIRCYHIATQYYKVGDYESARRYVCLYLSAKEDSPMAHKLFGQTLEAMGQKEKAINEYKRSLELENQQPDLILKVCQLVSDNDVHFDAQRARYWCERGEELYPHDPAIFRLKERLLTDENRNSNVCNSKDFEDLINSELKALPRDVNVWIRLFKLYLDTGRTQLAYNHIIDLESKHTFINDLTWYEYISEFYQLYYNEFKSRVSTDHEFYMHFISALERLVSLILAETQASVSKTVFDCISALSRFDKKLHDAHMINCTKPKVFEEFLKHMSAQLCLRLATFILKKAKKEQNHWKEATKQVQPLFLLSLTTPIDVDAPFTISLRESQKKHLKFWSQCGQYRVVQAANTLLSLTKESGPQLIEKISHYCNLHWREKLYQKVFGQTDLKEALLKSHFVQNSGFNHLPSSTIPVAQLRSPDYVKSCESIHPASLHHIVWLGLQTVRHSSPRPPQMLPPAEFHTYGFSDLQYTVHNLQNIGVESLNRLDLDSFLYATVLCAAAQLDDRIRSGFYSVDRPITLPADITTQLCTPEQAKWWAAAYKICTKKAGNNWGDMRIVLQRGIEVVRAVGNHGLDVQLLVQLARTFVERAVSCNAAGKGSPSYSEVAALEARANNYWKVALQLLERIEKKQALKVHTQNRLFEFQGKELEPSQVTSLLEEGRLFTACQLMKDEEYEAAIDAFKPLKSPYASFHSAGIFKKMAQAEINNCPAEEVTSEMRSHHVILLTKAINELNITKDRIQSDRSHPLHHILNLQISDVESKLSRIELDGVPMDDRADPVYSEASYSPPGSVLSHGESAGGDYTVPVITHHEMNGRHLGQYPGHLISSTPKSRHVRNILNNSQHQPKSGLTVADFEKMLATHEGAVITKVKSLFEEHCTKQLTDVSQKISTLEVVIDELRRDMNKLRADDLYMLGDDEDYPEDVLGFPTSYQPPPAMAQPQATPTHVAAAAAPAAFYPPAAPVARGAQGSATVTYGAPPPSHLFSPQFQPSPQPPAIQPHQLGLYSQAALPFSEGQQLPDFLSPGQRLLYQQQTPPPVNVVITTSDTLPTGPPPVQPTLSVTIPPKHRMGGIQTTQQVSVPPPSHPLIPNAPHEFQISMPPAAVSLPDLQKSPVNISAAQEDLESDEGEVEAEHDPYPDFKPIIPLPDEVVVTTGEESEKVLFECRSKLFRFVDKEWKERGIGMLKILHDISTNKIRLLMRREQVHKICANHYLTKDMEVTPMASNDRAWVWLANDFADEKLQVEKLCAKFKTVEDAANFKDAFNDAKNLLEADSFVLNELPPSAVSETPKDKQRDEKQSFGSISIGGFTMTSPPVIFPVKDDEKESKKQVATPAQPNPFASFSFNFLGQNQNQKSAFLTPSNEFSAVSSTSSDSGLNFKTPLFTSSPVVASTPVFNFNQTNIVPVTDATTKSSQNSLVLKPSTFSFQSQTESFVKTTEINKNIFQSPVSIFTPATSFVQPATAVENNDITKTSPGNILKTPIFSTPTGPNLVFNQADSTVLVTSSGTQLQSKQMNLKDVTESINVSNQSKQTAPKSILKETLASEPLSSVNISSNVGQKSAPKHVLFQDTVSTKDSEDVNEQGKEESSEKETITIRRPHKPLEKFLNKAVKPETEPLMFEMPTTDKPLDFSLLAKQADTGGFRTSDNFKGFAGAGSSVFKTSPKTVDKKNDNEEHDDTTEEFVPDQDFKPVIPLPELITVETGEEKENLVHQVRAKLLRYDGPTKQWKERGIGYMKILHDPHTNTIRLVMRREQVFKVCCNHRIGEDFELKDMKNSSKAWTWYAQDFSEGVRTDEFFAMRFKTEDEAAQFKVAIDDAKELLKKSTSTLDTGNLSNISSDDFNVSGSSDASMDLSGSINETTPANLEGDVWNVFRNESVIKNSFIPLSELNAFKRGKDTWECQECYTVNKNSSTDCLACQSKQPVFIEEIKEADSSSTSNSFNFTPSSAAGNTAVSSQKPLSELFKPKAGSWECSGCLIRNNADVIVCPICNTVKPGETAPEPAVSSAPSIFSSNLFGGQNTGLETTGFLFGIPKTTETNFSFGVTNTNETSTELNTQSSGFKFNLGTTANVEKPSVTSVFTKPIFGSPDTVPKSTPSTTFTFGAQNVTTPTSFVFKGSENSDAFNFNFGGVQNVKQQPSQFGADSDTIGKKDTDGDGNSKFQPVAPIFGTKVDSNGNSDSKFNFTFAGIQTPKPKSPTQHDTDGDTDGEDHYNNAEDEDNTSFQPVIPLPDKVPVTTGEENEEVLYSHRAKLYRYVQGEWKERGTGDVKVLKHRENKKIRLLMRREIILKLCLNHFLTPEIVFKPKDDKSWLWYAMDYSESEMREEKFAIRFKTADIAQDFKAAIDAAQAELSVDESCNSPAVLSTPVSSTTPVAVTSPESPAMKGFRFALPTSITSPSSPSGFSLASQLGGNTSAGPVKSLFGGASPKVSDSTNGDIEVVYEKQVSTELRDLALKLQLPPNFYSYMNAPGCPGCVGCDPEDLVNKNLSVAESITSSKAEVPSTGQSLVAGVGTMKDVTSAAKDHSTPATTENIILFKSTNMLSFSDLNSKQERFDAKADPNFQWAGANSSVFGSVAKPQAETANKTSDNESSDDEAACDKDSSQNEPTFEPVVPLPPLVSLQTGEEEEEILFSERAKLYKYYVDSKEWKERGVGLMKILYHPQRLTYRLLMRREQVHKIVCNHRITQDLSIKPQANSTTSFCWTALNLTDADEKPQVETLALRLKNETIAGSFYQKVAECIQHICTIKEQSATEINLQDDVGNADYEDEDDDDDYDDEDDDDDDGNSQDDDSDVDEDDDNTGWTAMVDMKITFLQRNTSQDHWATVGNSDLQVLYNTLNSKGQIKITAEKGGELLSCTGIEENSEMKVKKSAAVWTAVDTVLQPPTERQVMAKFKSEEDALLFYHSISEVKEYTKGVREAASSSLDDSYQQQ